MNDFDWRRWVGEVLELLTKKSVAAFKAMEPA